MSRARRPAQGYSQLAPVVVYVLRGGAIGAWVMADGKDKVDLICSIGELAGLFEKSRNLADFLQTVVSVVAYHMRAAVCSVYLLEDGAGTLVLTANQGLNPALIGHLRLRLGEGLCGLALQEQRPIREGRAALSPHYKPIPESGEDRYQSFLAVPILKGLTRVGVLAVQDPQPDYFTEIDGKALQAIAAQLATTIENARLFMSLYAGGEAAPAPVEAAPLPSFFHGIPASRGVASGRAVVIGRIDSYLKLTEELRDRPCSLEDFRRAVTCSQRQIEDLQSRLESVLGDVASMIFSAHQLMLMDEQFTGEMVRLIGDGKRPQDAVTEVVNRYVAMFARNANPLFQEKVQDVKDVGHRLLHNLLGHDDVAPDYAGEILIAGELLPSDIVKLSTQHAAGLVLVGGGVSSHVSILARSMELPVVIVDDRRLFEVADDSEILLDANTGSVFINPDPEISHRYRESGDIRLALDALGEQILPETYTRDGERVRLMANINLLSELPLAERCRAEGIGLYRSEFPFIVRSGFPSEEEQYRIYRAVVDGMPGRPVILRTLDIGGDKMLSYFPTVDEANPFLGLRALRFTLRNKRIFVQQLRAMLRAGAGADLGIMFPMVSSLDEFLEARDLVRQCADELQDEGLAHHPAPRLGPMIELPSAVEIAGELAAEADFLCIGTNDLVQYVLAVDRTNQNISEFYVPYHPAVLRSLKRVADAAAARGVPVSLCGEMGGDPTMIPFLVGIGIRQLSIDFRLFPEAQAAILALDTADARRQAGEMLALARISDLAAYLEHPAAAS